MTGFDTGVGGGRIRGSVYSEPIQGRPGEREQTTGEWWLHLLGKPEEFIARAASLKNPFESTTYNTRIGFSEALMNAGLAAVPATVLGIGLAIANPLDPLNKLGIGSLTKFGKVGRALTTAGDALKVGADGFSRLDKAGLLGRVASLTKTLQAGKLAKPELRSVKRSIDELTDQANSIDDLNRILVGAQQKGMKLEDLKLANSSIDQIRRGQRNLIGFASPGSTEHLRLFGLGRGFLDDASVMKAMPRKLEEKLAAGALGINNKVIAPIGDAASRLLTKIGVRQTDNARKVAAMIKAVVQDHQGTVMEMETKLESLLNHLRAQGISQSELNNITQAIEVPDEIKSLIQLKIDESAVSVGTAEEILKAPIEPPLTPAQHEMLVPAETTDAGAGLAVVSYKQAHSASFKIGQKQNHEAKFVGQYVVVRAGSDKGILGAVDELDGIYKQKVWQRHTDSEGNTFLVARRLPFSKQIRENTDFTSQHLRNLEVIAAQLGRKKQQITGITPSDILVSPYGGVQIINPDVIVEAKASKDALSNSDVALTRLAQDLGLPDTDLLSLKSVKAARQVPAGVDGMVYRSGLGDGDFVNSNQLLMQANNNVMHQTYIRAAYGDQEAQKLITEEYADFEYLNGIEAERAKYRAAMEAGERPYVKPIEIFKDDRGSIAIRDGRERLTAAVLEGIDAIPVKRIELFGEPLTFNDAFYVGTSRRLSSVWAKADNRSSANGIREKTIAQNYALIKPDGKVHHLENSDLVIRPDVSGWLNRMLTRGPNYISAKAKAARIAAAEQLLVNRFGTIEDSLLVVSELAEQAQDIPSFVKGLQGLLSDPQHGSLDLNNILIHAESGRDLGHLKNAASGSLDDLAEGGVLTPYTIGQERRVHLATIQGNFIAQIFDKGSNTLSFISPNATTAQLWHTAESFLKTFGPAEEVEPLANIRLFGADGRKELLVKDFAPAQHPIQRIVEPVTRQFKISDELKDELKQEGVIIYHGKNLAEVQTELKERGLNFGVLLSKDAEGKIIRPEYAFFVTKSGDIVVGLKHRDVRDLFKSVFKEAPPQYQEFGVMSTGKVIISQPLGFTPKKIGVREMGILKTRLTNLVKRFEDFGLAKGTVVKVHVPFDDAVWRAMYGERVTIGDILDEGFEFKIPEELIGHAPDSSVDAPGRAIDVSRDAATGVVAIERTRMANAELQRVFDTIRDTGDAAFLDEARAGLPVTYYEGYLGRNLTKGAREGLNDAWLKYPNKNSQSFKFMENFLKGRVFTDLTTLEVNEIIKRAGKEGVEGIEQLITDVVAEYRKGYILKPTPETARSLVHLYEALPTGVDFYYTNPIWATTLRVRQGQRAIARQEIVDSLKEMKVAVWNGSVNELRAARIGNSKKLLELQGQIDQTKATIVEKGNELAGLEAGAKDLAQKDIQRLQKELDDLSLDLANKMNARWGTLGSMGDAKAMDTMVDLNAEEVWIKGEDALALVQDGKITASDIVGDASDALVRVPIKKYESWLDEANAEVFLFPKDVASAVQRYFGTTTKTGFDKFLRMWDEVHAAWRSWTLFPIPAYHIRNGISSMFMAWLGGVTDPAVYRASFKTFSLLTSFRKGALTTEEVREALNSMQFANAAGQVTTGEELLSKFIHLGGFHGGLHRNEFNRFGNLRRASEFERLMAKTGAKPVSELAGSWIYDNSLIRLGVSAANWTENRFRFAAFVDSWRKAHTERLGGETLTGFDAAIMQVKRIYYDYSDLSQFERSWLTRTLPFYAWSRHNVPRMLTTLITDPVKHYRYKQAIDTLERGVVGRPVDENELEPWMRDKFGIVVHKTEGGSYVVQTAEGILPLADAFKVLSRGGIMSMFVDGLTPFVKVPLEQFANYSTYTKQAIEKYPGQRAKSFTLGALGFSRRATTEGPLSVLNLVLNESVFRSMFRVGGEAVTKVIDPMTDPRNYTKEAPGFWARVMALAVGRSYQVDPEQTKMMIFKNWKRTEGAYKAIRKRAEEAGDTTAVEDIDTQLNWLRLQKPEPRSL